MIFVIAETENGARELCAGARTLGQEVALVGFSGKSVVEGVSDEVYEVSVAEGQMLECASSAIAELIANKGGEIVLVEPTRRMRVIAGKIAFANNTSAICDVSAFDGPVATNRYFGGVAERVQKAKGAVSVFVCSGAPFGDVQASGSGAVQALDAGTCEAAKVVAREALPDSGVNLEAAKCVVAAGRGFSEESQLEWARTFAGKIGGELGCTRPLTEAEDWMPREAYIGISGLMLSPDVYVGLGISGQMQHMVGVNGARVAFAINKDANAPIFNQVDYGLVGDLATVLPAINDKL